MFHVFNGESYVRADDYQARIDKLICLVEAQKQKCFVYCYRDQSGCVVYIGSTLDPFKRDREHKYKSIWHSEGIRMEMMGSYNTQQKAKEVERKQIRKINPKHNSSHTNDGPNGIEF